MAVPIPSTAAQASKTPAETYVQLWSYARRLPSGASLVSGTVSAVDVATGSDKTAEVLVSPTATISGTSLSYQLKAGQASGMQYLLTIQATLTGSQVLEDHAVLTIL